jgi:hypothetical protein
MNANKRTYPHCRRSKKSPLIQHVDRKVEHANHYRSTSITTIVMIKYVQTQSYQSIIDYIYQLYSTNKQKTSIQLYTECL